MNSQQFKPLFSVAILAVIGFAINKLVLYFLGLQDIENNFQYSIISLYIFFMISSMVIILILQVVKQKALDSVGYTFMGLTLLKMAISYFLLTDILHSSSKFVSSEKIIFFVIFIVFLTTETVITIRILNNKQ